MDILQIVGKDITVGAFALVTFWLFYKMFFEIHQKYLVALSENTAVLKDSTEVLDKISTTLMNVNTSIRQLNERVSEVEKDLENFKKEKTNDDCPLG